jgi:DNA-binding transcriptional MerR regulator
MLNGNQNQPLRTLITSKEILNKTGISRATLNNYIKLGILPKPIVRKPFEGMETTRKIGYFPSIVLERLESVKELKKEGYTIDEIASRFKEGDEDKKPLSKKREEKEKTKSVYTDQVIDIEEELKISFEEFEFPSYLINKNFEIIWVNEAAEKKIFKQRVSRIIKGINRNIFKLFFHWELTSLIKNWKDLIAFHIAFAKSKFSHEWIKKIYKGISEREAVVLGELYEKTPIISGKTIDHRQIYFLNRDGTTKIFRVYLLFCNEGILFVYVPEENF